MVVELFIVLIAKKRVDNEKANKTLYVKYYLHIHIQQCIQNCSITIVSQYDIFHLKRILVDLQKVCWPVGGLNP